MGVASDLDGYHLRRRQRLEQYRTSSQQRAHFLRHVDGLLDVFQFLEGRASPANVREGAIALQACYEWLIEPDCNVHLECNIREVTLEKLGYRPVSSE